MTVATRLAFWQTDDDNPQKFTATLGELRAALRLESDPTTDGYEIEVPYRVEGARGTDGEQITLDV